MVLVRWSAKIYSTARSSCSTSKNNCRAIPSGCWICEDLLTFRIVAGFRHRSRARQAAPRSACEHRSQLWGLLGGALCYAWLDQYSTLQSGGRRGRRTSSTYNNSCCRKTSGIQAKETQKQSSTERDGWRPGHQLTVQDKLQPELNF